MRHVEHTLGWQVEYDYFPGHGFPFQATVSLFLPKRGDKDEIHVDLQCSTAVVFGEHLYSKWGDDITDQPYRVRKEEVVSSESWADLQKKVQEFKDSVQEKLTQVVTTNISNFESVPEDSFSTFVIP